MAASATPIPACQSARQQRGWHPVERRAAPRRLVVQAAAAPGGRGGPTAGGRQRQLVSLLLEQAQREVWGGWLSDLVLPLVSDDPGAEAPPPRTAPPRAIADRDGLFAEVDGVALHYKEAWPAAPAATATATASISQQLPTVLLVHGFNGSTFSWRSTMQPLADATGCRVIAFDRPPFGLAERPLSWGEPGQVLQYNPYSLEGSGRLAAGLLDSLGVQSVIAVGHSAGALVCMELAQRQPQRVAGLGFVAPALPTTPENSFARRATLGSQLRFLAIRGLLGDDTLGLRYMRRQILRRRDEVAAGNLGLQADESQVAQEVIDGYLKPLTADNWDRGALLNMRTFTIPPAYDYASLAQPVLLVQGSNDGGLTENARVLSRLLQQRPQGSTQFVEMPGVGHIPMDETPQQLNQLLIDFVQEAAGSGSSKLAPHVV